MSEENGTHSESTATQKGLKWWQWCLMYPAVFGILLDGAPTWLGAIQAHNMDVPYADVNNAKEQNLLWTRNLECSPDMKSLTMEGGLKVSSGSCPSGDVMVELDSNNQAVHRYWVASERLEGGSVLKEGFWGGLLHASEHDHLLALAQVSSNGQVLCSRPLGAGRLLRRINRGNGCVDEIINTYTGATVETRPAPCTPDCGS